jgi:hypothetical protein
VIVASSVGPRKRGPAGWITPRWYAATTSWARSRAPSFVIARLIDRLSWLRGSLGALAVPAFLPRLGARRRMRVLA